MDFPKLEELFISDHSSAIKECQKMIVSITEFDTYQDFYSYHLQNARVSTCQNEWPDIQACIFCRDCAVLSESCICISCFLNGNHEGHEYIINRTNGSCDCGDQVHWKKCGFCSKHHGLADNDCPENYLDEKLRTTLTDVIFKAAFSSLKHFTTTNSENADQILQFISSFLKFGDGFRRLISISLTERIDLTELMQGMVHYTSVFNESLQKLCGKLINDQLFLRNFSKISYDIIENQIAKDTPTIMSSGEKSITYSTWNSFWFHSLSSHCIRYNIEKFNWDWVKFGTNVLPYLKELFKFVNVAEIGEIPNMLISVASRMRKATEVQPNEQTQHFFDNIMKKILSCGSIGTTTNDTILVTSFSEKLEKYAYICVFFFKFCFYIVFKAFQNKPLLKLESLFDQLDKMVDITPIFLIGLNSVDCRKNDKNENDRFVSRFLDQKDDISLSDKDESNYKSFHNGAAFFLSYPLFESLVALFRFDELCRVKIARLFALKKFQNLRVKLGIVSLKSMLSFICNKQSLVPHRNQGIISIQGIFNKSDMVTFNYNQLVPVFQLLVGLHGNENSLNEEFGLKEFFAFELARELGIFDDFEDTDYEDENVSEKQKQMFFTFLFVSLLLVVERKLYHFDGNEFVREQIIFSLKNGIHSIDQLDQSNDYTAIEDGNSSSFIFNDILMSVASTEKNNETTENQSQNDSENEEQNESLKSGKQENLFYLKKNVEYNYISAINSLNDQMTIMNNQISKEPSKLLPLPTFEAEETFFFKATQNNDTDNNNELKIRLKEFLFTPTVLAIVYYSLRNPSQSSALNENLAMNILILISKFVKEDDGNKQSSFELDEIYFDDLVDLITKLKLSVFKYHVDENGNACIENTLNKRSFANLLKMKFCSDELDSKSFIDVLLEKGELGHSVLQQMSSYVQIDYVVKEEENTNKIENPEQNDKADKRKKANKLKAEIMNQFKDMIANYSQKGSDSIDAISSVSNSSPFGVDKEVCSICSTYKNNEVITYPLYIYRTKFPFIIDKPPKVSKDAEGTAIDNIVGDYETFNFNFEEEEEEDSNENVSNESDKERVMELIYEHFPSLAETEGMTEEQLTERENFINYMYQVFLESMNKKKKSQNYSGFLKKYQKEEFQKYMNMMETKQFKRCTVGANFVLQFNLCQHYVHRNCVKKIPFACPIDRSRKNCLLPSLDSIPKNVVFKDLDSFELNVDDESEQTLSESVIKSIQLFCDTFYTFIKTEGDVIQCALAELVKSISSLISTYEIRLRSLPDCLDSEKNIFLARNLFLTAWYVYRIYKKQTICSTEEEKRLTLFQRLIKTLIESDEIEKEEEKKEETFKKIISDFINKNKEEIDQNSSNEKFICLFLRRCCLAQHFLLDIDVSSNSISGIIDWDEILSPSNLSLLYGVKFTTIDVENGEEFEFKPFSFLNLPKEFLHLSLPPFSLPIEKISKIYIFNMLDYNYLINYYDEISGEIIVDDLETEQRKNQSNLFSCEDGSLKPFLHTFFSPRLSPSVILFVGKYVSQAFVISDSNLGELDTFYLDKYGCSDIGYKRSQPLFLNEGKFEKCIDMILSGDFVNTFFSDMNEQ